MANVPETPDYPAGIYQLETSDPVLGGAGGIANRQAEQLANRTAWLKAKIDAFIGGTVAVLKATKLATARTLSISGAASGSASFDGSANANIALTLADSGAVAGTYPKVTINAKGLVTGGSALLAADIPNLDWSKINSGKPTTLGGYGITDAAPIASPNFTGVPTGPTAAAGTNTTQLATTAFVAAVKALLDAADALKAPLASPALTGTPTAPTAADGTNTTQVASTAFVQSAVGGYLSKATTGGTVTLTDAEASNPVIAVSGALTSASVVVLPVTTKRLWAIYNATSGAFTVTVKTAAGTGVTIAQGQRNLVYTDGTNIYDAFNDFESIALTGTPTAPTAAAGTNTTQVATTAFVAAVKALLAPLASPALTGTPTAPTAAVGNNSTQVATTAFVNAEIANDAYLKTDFSDRVTSKGGNANGSYRVWASGRKDMIIGAVLLTAPSVTLTLPIALGTTIGANVRATVLGGAGAGGVLSVEVLSTTQIKVYCSQNCNVMVELNGDIA
ncbi:hypothetical protein V3394_18305 [Pseudomonas aeruginosa]|uniref:hypothetical protein n=1 Tax=Pseudomonas aeruginosa TaxID=287 RepID=UPI0030026DD8